MTFPLARWWHLDEGGRVVCDLCPRSCSLAEGQEGYCGARLNDGGSLRTAVGGRTSGLCVDPIEKKPLYHFLPGTEVLSFGTVGCNLGCLFCQNWELSRAEDFSRLRTASPEDIVRTALARRCSGVAFTYNEPIVSAEYCLEVAQACREAGLKTVAVTAGYVSGSAREAFFQGMDAANVDLKGFSDAFYRHYCSARLEPVLETLEYLAQDGRTWTEITNLLIPTPTIPRPTWKRSRPGWRTAWAGTCPCTSAPSTRLTGSWTGPRPPSRACGAREPSRSGRDCALSTWATRGTRKGAPPSVPDAGRP
jgi:pyruvate formate lyase activating enzyme